MGMETSRNEPDERRDDGETTRPTFVRDGEKIVIKGFEPSNPEHHAALIDFVANDVPRFAGFFGCPCDACRRANAMTLEPKLSLSPVFSDVRIAQPSGWVAKPTYRRNERAMVNRVYDLTRNVTQRDAT